MRPLRYLNGGTLSPFPAEAQQQDQREIMFVLIEPSVFCTKELRIDASFRQHMARGHISDRLRREVMDKLAALRHGATVDGVSLGDYKSAKKILLVHYAVRISRLTPWAVTLRSIGQSHAMRFKRMLTNVALPHHCDGLRKLVEALSSDIDLVVHGHLHYPKVYRYRGVPIISVSTTMQAGGYNSFFLLKFYRSGHVRYDHHRWLNERFVRDSRDVNRSLDMRLARAAGAR